MTVHSDALYAAGRTLLLDTVGLTRRQLRKRKKPRSELERVLQLHLYYALERAMDVEKLFRRESITSAAALTRTIIETAYSGAYIGLAPKARRLHRVQRFNDFEHMQISEWFSWRATLGFSLPEDRLALATKNSASALRRFRKLESDLRVGWSGERVSEIVKEVSAGPYHKVLATLQRAYRITSFMVHPTPFGMSQTVVRPVDKTYALGIPLTVLLCIEVLTGIYGFRAKRKMRLHGEKLVENFVGSLATVGQTSAPSAGASG